MRPADLIPDFIWEAKRLHLTRSERKTVTGIDRASDADGYFDTENAVDDLGELFTILDAHSLPYFYFGAHPSDGADYGWWLSESFEENFADASTNWAKSPGSIFPDAIKVNDLADVPKGYTGEVLDVNDHGNCSLYRAVRGRLYEIWAVV